MRTLIAWALERRYSIILLAIAFVQLFPPVTCALLVLDTCRHGPNRGLAAAAIVLIGVAVVAVLTGGGMGAALLAHAASSSRFRARC
jgi:membrane protease YdiL (CAAX protease family)